MFSFSDFVRHRESDLPGRSWSRGVLGSLWRKEARWYISTDEVVRSGVKAGNRSRMKLTSFREPA